MAPLPASVAGAAPGNVQVQARCNPGQTRPSGAKLSSPAKNPQTPAPQARQPPVQVRSPAPEGQHQPPASARHIFKPKADSPSGRDLRKSHSVVSRPKPVETCPSSKTKQPKLLSLDGGGVRGLSSLLILEKLMNLHNDQRRAHKLSPQEPYDIFDVVGGTSTGGLIALMLGRLGMGLVETIREYKALSQKIFQNRKHKLTGFFQRCAGSQNEWYSSALVREVVEELVARKTGNKDTLLWREPGKPGFGKRQCMVLLCATYQDSVREKIFRSFGGRPAKGGPTIVQAALATTAAPLYFDPVEIHGDTYVDGGLLNNNPVWKVWNDAKLEFMTDKDEVATPGCLISIGTGEKKKISLAGGIIDVLKGITLIVSEGRWMHDLFVSIYPHLNRSRYFRFNVEKGLDTVELDDWGQTRPMQLATDAYMELEPIKVDLINAARLFT